MTLFIINTKDAWLAWGAAKTSYHKLNAFKNPVVAEAIREKVREHFNIINDSTLEITKLPLVIGRFDEKTKPEDIPDLPLHAITYVSVSRKHAIIYEEKGIIKLRDLGSKYGTFLCISPKIYEKIEKEGIELKDGATIKLGYLTRSEFAFTVHFMQPGLFSRITHRIKDTLGFYSGRD